MSVQGREPTPPGSNATSGQSGETFSGSDSGGTSETHPPNTLNGTGTAPVGLIAMNYCPRGNHARNLTVVVANAEP